MISHGFKKEIYDIFLVSVLNGEGNICWSPNINIFEYFNLNNNLKFHNFIIRTLTS